MRESGRMDRMRLLLLLPLISSTFAATPEVKTPDELKAAVPKLKTGDTLKIGAGEYPGGSEISGWGGQAIDFVGCWDSIISACKITGKKGFSQHTGPQFKGGCRNITIEKCVLKDVGERPIHAGGSTGLDYFRPHGAKYEAK